MRLMVNFVTVLFSLLFVSSFCIVGQTIDEIKFEATTENPVFQFKLGVKYEKVQDVQQNDGEAVQWTSPAPSDAAL